MYNSAYKKNPSAISRISEEYAVKSPISTGKQAFGS